MSDHSVLSVLSGHRRAQISVFCGYALLGFANVTQAGRYALHTLSIAGDGPAERAAILSAIWEYHRRVSTGEIPF